MKQLTARQQSIYDLICNRDSLSNLELQALLPPHFQPISRVTIVRDLETLLQDGLIEKIGQGRTVRYRSTDNSPLLKYYDPDLYFQQDDATRSIRDTFNFGIFSWFTDIFSHQELEKLWLLTRQFQKNKLNLSPLQHQKEMERLTIELSWKSSQIEGNTYSLLDTEALIKEHREAPGHSKEEAIMILNHKKALDYIFQTPNAYDQLTVSKIEDLHRLLMGDLGVDYGLRQGLFRIIGTSYRPLENQYHIRESLEKLCHCVGTYKDPFHRAVSTIVLLSYIQPFMDGNKRTARILGNALLCAGDACPLSYRSVDPVDYKKAMLLFYEQNSIRLFKDLFITQYEFSVTHYFS